MSAMTDASRTEALDAAVLPWLLAGTLASAAPHAAHLPPWLTAVAAAALLLRFALWRGGRALPPRWFTAIAVLGATGGIFMEYRTLFGRDAGVALLVLLAAMKLLETRTRRDAMVVVMLGYFLLLTHYFYSQSIATGAWLLLAATLATATLLRLAGGAQAPAALLRYAAAMLLQAMPLMLALFLLFPRVNGPLWGLPQDAYGARSGLPESIAPGSMSDLVRDGAIAFHVRFATPPPLVDSLYWRGPVMDDFDGRRWRPTSQPPLPAPRIDAAGTEVGYEITLEPHNQRWLLALDLPTSLPPGATLGPRFEALAREPVRQRARFAFVSSPDYRAGGDESPRLLAAARRLPHEGNARARALAAGWQAKFAAGTTPTPQAAQRIVDAALFYFAREGFRYTLKPQPLGADAIDDFLFTTHEGFCEHYATAFAFLMRAAGVPARVVAGYQGGEFNPVDGTLVVRQSDAHAWDEVWIAGRGWVRVDPTAASVPARIAGGIAAALPAGETLPVLARVDIDWLRQLRFRFDAVNNVWNQWVLGYNPDSQREALARLGLGELDRAGMGAALAAACGLMLLLLGFWALRRRQEPDPVQRAWLACCRRLAAQGLRRHDWEGPLDYSRRVAAQRPDLAAAVQAAAASYCAARYAPQTVGGRAQHLTRLRQATRRLPRSWRFV